ncbi:MAG: ABC transporter permease, partial [Bacteroidaceae bacterium]|nr:ABC transporter permease [Bacteroidaceae bacterium]
YSFIYTNEVVRDMPIAVVDLCGSQSSREFARRVDASPEVCVAYHCTDLEEAKQLMQQQKVHGILYFPSDFEYKLERLEQSPIEIYCDMGFMLYYKAFYLTAFNVMLEVKNPLVPDMGDVIKVHEVTMFNQYGGYANFLLPSVLVLILQQTLLLVIGTEVGTRRQRGLKDWTLLERMRRGGAFYTIYLLLAAYVLVVVPLIFQFTQFISPLNLLLFIVPMLLAMVTFAMLLSVCFHRRETPLLCIAYTSVILLFLTGMSWPECNIPTFWETFAWIFPSTPAVRAFVRMNCMGADITLVSPYIWALLIQSVVYFTLIVLIDRIPARWVYAKGHRTPCGRQ